MKQKILSLFCSLLCLVLVTTSVSTVAYAAGPSYGLDISEHNGANVPFSTFKKNGKSFVMIRIGYYNHIDKQFWNNVKKANDAKIPFGVYLYSYAYSVEEAKIEAEFVVETLSKLGSEAEYFKLPVAYDLEDSQLSGFSKNQLTNQCVTFCDIIRSAGYTPMVYANLNWFNNYLDIKTLDKKDYKLWYANWSIKNGDNSKPVKIGSTGIEADVWQYNDNNAYYKGTDSNVAFSLSSITKDYGCSHKYTKKTTAAKCGVAGKITYTCSSCKKSFSISIPAINHTPKTVVTKATTSKDGKTSSVCSRCGKTLSSTTIPRIKSIGLSTTSYTYDGKVKKPSVTVKDTKGKTVSSKYYTVTYPSGRKNIGKYGVKITFKGNYSGAATRYFNICPKVSLSTTNYTYTGGVKKPSVTVKDSKGNKVSSKYYSVTYSSGRKNIGKYAVKITFKGKYSGTLTRYFYICPKVSISSTSYTYNGKVKTPTVTVRDSKNNKVSSKYYSVSYSSGRKYAGQYTVTVKFKGKYSGTIKKTFKIRPKSTSISKLSAGTKKFTVKWNKQTTQTTGYQIQYSTSSKFSSAKYVTVSGNKYTSKSVSKLSSKKKYYVRVRTYKTVKVDGKSTRIYSPWSATKSVKTK